MTTPAALPRAERSLPDEHPAGARPLATGPRDVLEALCRRMVPHAYAPGAPTIDLATQVETRLREADPALRRQVAALLALFDHPAVSLLLSGRLRRFTRRTPEAQDHWLRAWEHSRLAPRRTIFQAFRRLVLSTYYAMPSVRSDTGYRGPLHTRAPELPWEGPLPGNDPDDGPVARSMLPLADALGPARSYAWAEANGVPEGVMQGRELAHETTLRADVCVIGTGAGGAVAAARLAEAGRQVVILEEGSYWTAADFTEEEGPMMSRLYADAGARATDDLALSILQGRCVGGSTTVNWLIMLRTPDWVLEEWTREHGTVGMSPREMASVFELIEKETHTRLVPEDAHSPNNQIILNGARRLGWKAQAARINARECVRSGFCGLGCRYGAKQSTLLTYIPRALRAGARLFSDVSVERIERAERGTRAPLKRVHGTVLDRTTGRPRGRLTVEAPLVVLAAGAIGTPAILQRSALGGGGVGRYLRLHPTTAVVARYGHEIYGAAGIPLSAVCDEFLRGEDGYGFWVECPPLHPALAAVAMPGFGAAHRDAMEAFPRLGSLIVLVRDGADRRESNGAVRVDRSGRARIRYRMGPADRRNLVRGSEAAARLHLAAGAEEVRTLHNRACRIRSESELDRIRTAEYGPNQMSIFSAHVNGTCRLGGDPRTSGCSPEGEVHGIAGLYVADGSVLPTAPGVNPQETIMAMATVIARGIIERHRSG